MNQNLDVFTFIDNVRLGCLHLDIQTFIVLLFDQACIACVPGLCQDGQVFLQIIWQLPGPGSGTGLDQMIVASFLAGCYCDSTPSQSALRYNVS